MVVPCGFVVSRAYLDFHPAYAVWEVELAILLALGEIGHDGLFTRDAPPALVVVGDSAAEASAPRDELPGICPACGGRVVLDQMVAPALA